jgi:predicted phage terminase large subunit-like protein
MDLNQSLDILIQPARKDFWSYCCYYDYDFFRIRRPFLYVIAESCQQIYEKIINKLGLSIFPRAGKSYILSLFCSWLIGKHPDGAVMRNCCTAHLYNKFSYTVREIIKSEKFKKVFPDVKLSQDKTAVTGWNTTEAKQVSYFGNGVGGTIIGMGATLCAITDDLYRDHEDYISTVINDKIHFWYDSAHGSRIEKECPRIDIGTRWGEDDIIGTNIKKGFYDKVISIPAMIDGKSYCEDVKTTQEFLEIKQNIDSYIWESEYMQNPIPLEGIIFHEFKYYNELNDIEGVTIAYADTADDGNNHFAMPIVKIINGKCYILDVIFNRNNLDANEPLLLGMIEKYRIDYIWVETNREGGLFMKNLKKKTACSIRGIHNTPNKMSRIFAQSGFIQDNFLFKKNHPNEEYDMFIKQALRLLKTSKKEDDAADSLAGAAFIIRSKFGSLLINNH